MPVLSHARLIMTSITKNRICLSDAELVSRLELLARRERFTTLQILLLLDEMDRRRLHASLGYASLFDFATRRLGYSASAAGRRIQAARCIRRHPEVIELLQRNEVNLSTISLLSRILNDANKRGLLDQVRNKSQREVEAIVAAFEPRLRLRDRVRAVALRVAEPAGRSPQPCDVVLEGFVQSASESESPLVTVASDVQEASMPGSQPAPEAVFGRTDQLGDTHSRSGSAMSDTTEIASEPLVGHPPSGDEPAVETRFVMHFAASAEFMAKLDQARALLSNRGAAIGLERVFAAALDAFLDRHSPIRRQARRETQLASRSAARVQEGRDIGRVAGPRAGRNPSVRRQPPQPRPASSEPSPRPQPGRRPRHIPLPMRDAVFARDDSRCTFVGPDGERCGATHHLHIDHVVPFGRGGPHTIENLRVLCAAHNQLEAWRAYGKDWIERFA
jgi:5-methylcytosine-specific restriction endonuclease McrA/predicted component of type VI protein secretion system